MNYEFISNIHENSELKDSKRKRINCLKKRRLFQFCQSGKDQESLYLLRFFAEEEMIFLIRKGKNVVCT